MTTITVRNLTGEPQEISYTDALGQPHSTMIYKGYVPLPEGSTIVGALPAGLLQETCVDSGITVVQPTPPAPAVVPAASSDTADNKKKG